MAKGVTVKTNHKLEKEIHDLFSSDMYVKVGILGKPDNNAGKASDKRKGEPTGKTNIEIGAIHEFGTDDIPQRSFIRSTWEDEKRNIDKVALRLIKRNINKGGDPKNRIEDGLKSLGVWFVGKIKKKFRNNDWPALKNPSSRRRGKQKKGFIGPPRAPKPLIDTGQLRASIGFEVVSKKR
jgi:hypothetical protein